MIDLIPQDESVSREKLIIGIAPPTLASYLNSTPLSSAALVISLNLIAKCPLLEVTTSFPCLNALCADQISGPAVLYPQFRRTELYVLGQPAADTATVQLW